MPKKHNRTKYLAEANDMSHWGATHNDSSRTPLFVYRGGKTSNQEALPLSDDFFHGLPER